jgi:carbon starvation protein
VTTTANPPPPPRTDHLNDEQPRRGPDLRQIVLWGTVALVGAVCWGVIALARDEQISAIWLLGAALGTYAIGYRFYSKFIVKHVLEVDDTRATPAERLNNGVDFEPTDRRVLFGHHFAAIAGAGPLVGPVLAAQMGYLPGTIWIIVGVIVAGAVQDMVILFSPCAVTARAWARWRARRSGRWAASPRWSGCSAS